MAVPTKQEIEHKLLTGMSVSWNEENSKKRQLILGDPKARALFRFLLGSNVRVPTDLPDVFLEGLVAVYEDSADEDDNSSIPMTQPDGATVWKLYAIETEGFGGINAWNGAAFRFSFELESLLLEGPNGSGKSSFAAAILWALTGERPRDYADGSPHEEKPVFHALRRELAGAWPPIASYPPTTKELSVPPIVRVRLDFKSDTGETASVERVLKSGVVSSTVDPRFNVPSVLLETGLLMPARLAGIRFGVRANSLTGTVQTLTGLDDLASIGLLVEGLCHKSREYLSYKKKDLVAEKRAFEEHVSAARTALEKLEIPVPPFAASDTSYSNSAMAMLGRRLAEKVAEISSASEKDVGDGIRLTSSADQSKVLAAIAIAEEETSKGLGSIEAWRLLEELDRDLDQECIERMNAAIALARKSAAESLAFLVKSQEDTKFRLKAVAAAWHEEHRGGEIANCPLCDQGLEGADPLVSDLEQLRLAGSVAMREFDDNINSIMALLDQSIPSGQRHIDNGLLSWEPRMELIAGLKKAFVEKERFGRTLKGFCKIAETALDRTPGDELTESVVIANNEILLAVEQRAASLERAIALVGWFRESAPRWREWWEETANTAAAAKEVHSHGSSATAREGLHAHLSRLSSVLKSAEPYQSAADSLRKAWSRGKEIVQIEKELSVRFAIAGLIEPLKMLTPLTQAIARDMIEQLSGRIEAILSRVLITEELSFQDAQLQKREGIVVYGGFGDAVRFDATFVANTSWLRAVLWAFIFALREEAVEQLGADCLPLIVLDDPQATFDGQHRYRWAMYVASLQSPPKAIQLVLTSHDQVFLEQIKIAGVVGRQAICAAAGADLGHMRILEGDSLARKWKETKGLNTPQAGRDYMIAVRVYLEGLLQLMLRGEDAAVSTFVIGNSRDKLDRLTQSGRAPWDRPEFKKLVSLLGKQVPEVKHIESSHHSSGLTLGMAEAVDVEAYWRRKLGPMLEDCFRLARESLILHGGLSVLTAPRPVVTLPQGYDSEVANLPLSLLGKAAALTDGRTADGCLEMDEYAETFRKRITLATHSVYQLTSATLEPVARTGDLLLVKKSGEVSVKSLAVVISESRILARRFEVAENHSDVAVLTAQSINPRKILPPVIAQKSTIILNKIVGVLYRRSELLPRYSGDQEVSECVGAAELRSIAVEVLGLVEVSGHSAEPLALDGQFLIVGKPFATSSELSRFDGQPVIAADSRGDRYFKRLRLGTDWTVLESMDSAGDYAPIILGPPANNVHNSLESVWPVLGVLFELPR